MDIDWTALIEKAALPVELYLWATAKTVSVRVVVEERGSLHPVAQHDLDVLIGKALSNPTLFPFWNAQSLLLLCAFCSLPALQRHAKSFEAAADSSPGGMLTQKLYQRLGLTGRQLSLASPEGRLSDLKELLQSMPTLAIACDSHGPYRSISPGMARIALHYRDAVRPLSAVTNRGLHVFRRIGMAVPLPTGVVAVAIGAPLAPEVISRPIGALRTRLEEALSGLEAKLRTLFASGMV